MKARAINSVSVNKLFGTYDYELVLKKDAVSPDRLMILYGDNGSGKTTILRILFYMLAPDLRKGFKTVLSKIPFSRCHIYFTTGDHVWLQRPEGKLIGGFEMGIRIKRQKEKKAKFHMSPEGGINPSPETDGFLKNLGELNVGLYLLSDDRTVSLAGLEREESLSENLQFVDEDMVISADVSKRIIRGQISNGPEWRAQELLVQSLKRSEKWIQSQAMRGATKGESSVNTLYAEIVTRIARLPDHLESGGVPTLERRINKLQQRSRKFSQYGLLPEFNGRDIMEVVKKAPDSHVALVSTVVTPYIESVERKLDAMENIQRQIDSLVRLVNSFYTRKKLIYEVHDGFRVVTEDGKPIQPQMLSSGERHLLLLFCNTIQALDRPSIFIIDEPEISLNIKWQRRLISALIECAADNPVQYIFATHSFELLAKFPHNVIKLTDEA